ncbi:arrestin domain-containing protein 2 isoform X2 [Rhizophagus clarus]|uniref:Arrestin domain-containing protein 2 isoform X2 n=1 Tax=Rhizophagus clarus TaxID=94130 RepID=A0A8H3LVT2_9GLOM|nr:arrestin domain-containing protein 2 isoform X2 [Rhizophagus clarus]
MTSPTSANPTKTNRPPLSSYLKPHKNITFSYEADSVSFQQGTLGDSDSFLTGVLHLHYQKQHQIKSVILHLKGAEKTSWHKAQARSKALYTGEQILVDQPYKIWESEEEVSLLNHDIPFKVKLPYNLPETITTEIGSVNYTLRATINRKGSLVSPTTQIVEIQCPLKRTITIDNANCTPYKLRGESRSGLDYTFVLPPNKNFNLGTYVSMPMRIRFLRPGISVERVEITLKTCMDFRCNNPNETRHVKEQSAFLVVPRQEIRYLQPLSHHYEGECVHTINLFIPRSVQPTYSGRFISITHQLCIKFCLWGADMDFQVEESVRVANIYEKFPTEHISTSPSQVNRNLLSPSPYDSASHYSPNQSVYDPDEISIDIRDKEIVSINNSINNSSNIPIYPEKNHHEFVPQQHRTRRPSQSNELPPPFHYHPEGQTVAPKSPPRPPPTPIPPISTPNLYDGMPSPNPSPNSSKLPPYADGRSPPNNEKLPIRSPTSPPPYRGRGHSQFEAYTYNFDD